jgi:transposase
MAQIAAVEAARDAVVEKETPADTSERMIRDLSRVRGIGVESATLLVREAFCRNFANRRALGSYAGLTATPFASGSMMREQGISKDGNRRLRACLVELAWFWLRYQRESGLARWFCSRVNGAKGRVAKIMIVALARKLLIALWRFAKEGVIPEGATMKAA